MHHIWICIHLTDCSQCSRIICSPPLQFSMLTATFSLLTFPFRRQRSPETPLPEANLVAMSDRMMWTLRATMPITIKCPTMEENITWRAGKTCLVVCISSLLPTFDQGDKRYPCKQLVVYVWSTIHGNQEVINHHPWMVPWKSLISWRGVWHWGRVPLNSDEPWTGLKPHIHRLTFKSCHKL